MNKLISTDAGTARFFKDTQYLFQGKYEINIMLNNETGRREPSGVVVVSADDREVVEKARQSLELIMHLDHPIMVGALHLDTILVKLCPMKIFSQDAIYQLEMQIFD